MAARSQKELLNEVTGPMIGQVLDWTLAIFLFLAAGIMMAGSGAVFEEHWHLPRLLGIVLMALLAVGTVLLGLRGVVASISAVAPVLIGMVLLISLTTVFRQGISPADLAYPAPREAAFPWWPACPTWSGTRCPCSASPGTLPGWITTAYSLVLWAEVYTTAVSSLYGLAVRFVPEGTGARYRWFTLAAGAGALLVSQLGFARMVALVFPLVGWMGLLFMAGLGIRFLTWNQVPAR